MYTPRHQFVRVASALFGILEIDVKEHHVKVARKAVELYRAGKTTPQILVELGIRKGNHGTKIDHTAPLHPAMSAQQTVAPRAARSNAPSADDTPPRLASDRALEEDAS